MKKDRFLLTLPAKAQCISVARLTVSGILQYCEASLDDLEDTKLALSEACIEALACGAEEEIHIEFLVDSESLLIEVRGFEGEVPMVELSNERQMSRLIMQSLVDEVDYGSGLLTLKKVFE